MQGFFARLVEKGGLEAEERERDRRAADRATEQLVDFGLTSDEASCVVDRLGADAIVEAADLTALANWENRTGCFAPLRYYFTIPTELDAQTILHLRDPRDVLVSLYFSEAYSHNLFKGVFDLNWAARGAIITAGLDRYVLRKAETFNQ